MRHLTYEPNNLTPVKHFILDFWYQPPYMRMNKGTYGHPGGLLHAVATLMILLFFTNPGTAITLAMTECGLHYFIDFAKMNINRIKGWKSNEHPQFWALTCLDQLLHQLTYVLICVIALA